MKLTPSLNGGGVGNLDFLEVRRGKPSASECSDLIALLLVLSATLAGDWIRDVVWRVRKRRPWRYPFRYPAANSGQDVEL